MENNELVLKTCLTAGRIMTESGSEVYRVEDTMNRIAKNAGYPNSVSYVTATGLFMGLGERPLTQLENVTNRSIDLEKVAEVNQLSRAFQAQKLTLQEFYDALIDLERENKMFPFWWQVLGAGVVSGTLCLMFGNDLVNVLPAFLIAAIAYWVDKACKKIFEINFLNDFLASLVIGILAVLAVKINFGNSMDGIIIGAVMPLVPGVAITNSFRDILAGHLVSGTARVMEAVFTAGAIGIGIAVSLKLFF